MQAKYTILKKCIFYDAIGMATYFIPVVGPFLDLIWAPFAASQMMKMFPSRKGKVAALFVFLEEITTFDIIPSFTIMWLYTFVWQKKSVKDFQPEMS